MRAGKVQAARAGDGDIVALQGKASTELVAGVGQGDVAVGLEAGRTTGLECSGLDQIASGCQ